MTTATWTTQEEYEAIHGTQAAQAAKQCGTVLKADGPWHLTRKLYDDGPETELFNSVRTTFKEADDLRQNELIRVGVVWNISRYQDPYENNPCAF